MSGEFDTIRQALGRIPDSGDGPDYHAEIAFWREGVLSNLATLEQRLAATEAERDDAEECVTQAQRDIAGLRGQRDKARTVVREPRP